MKLLLTSAGLTNASICNALFELVEKKPEETSLVFVPTAVNAEVGDKSWFIDDLINLKRQGLKTIDIADISAVDEYVWRPKFEEADVLFFEGGNTFHLMEWMNKSGLRVLLPQLLETKVYVGLSAGSMITNPDLSLKISQLVYEEDFDKTSDMEGLGLVDFYFLPHLNSEYFPKLRESHIKETVNGSKKTYYAMDDHSALKIVDGKTEVVSEGKWFMIGE